MIQRILLFLCLKMVTMFVKNLFLGFRKSKSLKNHFIWIYMTTLVSANMVYEDHNDYHYDNVWTYQGVSGPTSWAFMNNAWSLCSFGKYQSPIDIKPEHLVFDPNLTKLEFNASKVGGRLENTAQDITMELIPEEPNGRGFTFTGGPLSYTYVATRIKLHLGDKDDTGSEHLIAGYQFPLEMQIIGYNMDLYKNLSEAQMSSHGLAMISILGRIDDTKNEEFDKIVRATEYIKYRGMKTDIFDFSLLDVIPQSDFFITYEGSLTHPACQETATWIIINKPLYITKSQMEDLRDLHKWNHENLQLTPLIKNNFRPPQEIHRRLIRTNVSPFKESEECAFKITRSYQVNKKLIGL